MRNLPSNIWMLKRLRFELEISLLENFTICFIGIAPKNGGQILKKLLIDEEYDLSLFKSSAGNEFQIQRKKLWWA